MSDVIEIINIDQIKKLIPHRAPFLLIDRVENVVSDREAKLIPPPDSCEKHACSQKTKLALAVVSPAAVW